MRSLYFIIITVLFCSHVLPVSSEPRVKSPRDGMGLVILEFNGAQPREFELMAGFPDKGSAAIIQTEIPWFRLHYDDVSQRFWLIDHLKAGTAVLYGQAERMHWQVRFDAEAPHFVVPNKGYVFVGAYDNSPVRSALDKAISAGKMPKSANIHGKPLAFCNETIMGFIPAMQVPDVRSDAQRFLERKLKKPINLSLAEIEMKPFDAKPADGWINAKIAQCIDSSILELDGGKKPPAVTIRD